jgi:hypothetical protein
LALIIVVGEWKKKAAKILAVLIIIGIFTASMPLITGKLHQYIPVMGAWFKDEHPSGNPMRVENKIEKDDKKNDIKEI